jgi:serine/threonine protein kinase
MDYTGRRIAQYQIIEKLGQGGMAAVYRAYDTRLERDVAIKVVRKESIPPEQLERILKRFEREAKSLAKFLHPNIVPVHDYGEFEGAPYLAMAYLPGGTLKDKIGSPIPVQEALSYIVPIANALAYAHRRGVIHRDVKPSNILITEDGTVMLSDFGIAQILEESTTQLTATGMGVGTPEYMAPEQWQGKATEASDQYALGVVLYELLTGQKPFSAETPLAVALKVMSDPLPKPSEFVNGIPEDVEKMLYKVLARDPQDRYEDMHTLKNALESFFTELNEIKAEEITDTNYNAPDKFSSRKPPTKPTFSASEIEHKNPTSDLHETESVTFDEIDKTSGNESETPIKITKKDSKSDNKTPANAIKYKPAKRKSAKSLKISLGMSVGTILIVGVTIASVIGYVLLLRSLSNKKQETIATDRTAEVIVKKTVQAQATAAAIIEKTATANAQATAEAKSQMTATASSAFDLLNEYTDGLTPVIIEPEWELEHIEDGYVKTYYAADEIKDFVLEVSFSEPYSTSVGSWDFGIIFRSNYINTIKQQYRLIIKSNGFWTLEKWRDSEKEILYEGTTRLNLQDGKENSLQFIAHNNEGYLFINDNFISSFQFDEIAQSGDLLIGTGFIGGNEIEGHSTRFTNLEIFDISPNVSQPANSNEISLNSHSFYPLEEYSSHDRLEYQALFENSKGWEELDYSLSIYTDMSSSTSYYCRFDGGDVSIEPCEFRTIDGDKYLFCTQNIFLDYFDHQEYYCEYDINLLANNEILYNYHFSYTFKQK